MRLSTGWSIAALLVLIAGCGGGGGGGSTPPPPPPPPPPPTDSAIGGIWTGELAATGGGTLAFRALIAETGEFRWLDDAQGQQIFGTLDVDGTDVSSTNAISALPWGSVTPAGSRFGVTDLTGTIEERESLSGEFMTTGEEGDEFSGTFAFDYLPLYERASSLATLQGTYTTATDTLTIDNQGAIVYQSSANSCAANGSAELIDAAFNMYRVEFDVVAGCTGNEFVRNGLTFSGLAYLKDSQGGSMNDTVEFAVSAASADAYVVWSLDAKK